MTVRLGQDQIPDQSTLAVMTLTGMDARTARMMIAVAISMWPNVMEYRKTDGKQAVSLPLVW